MVGNELLVISAPTMSKTKETEDWGVPKPEGE